MTQETQDLPEIRQRVRDLEHELVMIGLELEWDTAVRSLGVHPGWVSLRSRLQTLLHSETEKFLKMRMELYDLGRCQGTLRTLRIAVQDEPLKQERIDTLKREASVLQDELVEQRRLLE